MSTAGASRRPEVTRDTGGASAVWLIPLVTLVVGGWLVVKTLAEQGPEVTISFRTAAGIEVGKTRVKYKSVDIGLVEGLAFSEDFSSVIVTARFNQGMDQFLRRNTRFWVVKPKLSVRGATGLETLVSGAYIEIDPGPGAPQQHFVGLEEQPLVTADDAGARLTLMADELGSVDTGSPIYYQGLVAGEVLGYELASDAQSVYIFAFVRDPFHQLVRGNTRFWNVSGLDVSLGADGLEVRTASVQSLLFGGIAFETPPTLEPTPVDVSDLVFTLHPTYDSIREQAFTRRLRFVLYFDGSVRGLNPGAPVEFKGIKVGSVQDIRLEFDRQDESFRIPVVVELEPDRIIDRDPDEPIAPEQILRTLIDRGLRARLQTGNLLTGQLFVELNMYPDAPLMLRGGPGATYPELPTLPGSLATITATLERFVAQLDEVDLAAIGTHLEGVLAGTDALVNHPKGAATVTDLEASLRALRSLLEDLDEGDLDATLVAATAALWRLEETLTLTGEVLEPSSPLQYSLTRTMAQLEELARSVRTLVELLERRPNALLFGREGRGRQREDER